MRGCGFHIENPYLNSGLGIYVPRNQFNRDMVDWITVTISLVGSLIVSIVSVHFQNEINRRQRIDRETEEWYHEAISICQWLRRKALQIEYDYQFDPDSMNIDEPHRNSDVVQTEQEKLDDISKLMKSLLELHTESPPEVPTEITNKLDEFNYWYNNIHQEEDEFSTTVVKNRIVDECEGIVEKCISESERYEDVPY